jgi:hypothetical protein
MSHSSAHELPGMARAPGVREHGGLAQLVPRLGVRVEDRWRALRYEAEALPDIAAEELERAGLHERLDPLEIVRWVHGEGHFPEQDDLQGFFAQPPVTLFRGNGFFVSALFWADASTAIHHHDFSGAFQVLAGASLHAEFDFLETQRVSDSFLLGELMPRGIDLAEHGAIERVTAGAGHVHSVLHLERPTVTLLVRSVADAASRPLYVYFPPHVAWAPEEQSPRAIRRLQTLGFLNAIGSPEYTEISAESLAQADLETAFVTLNAAHSHLGEGQDFDALVDRVSRRHGEDVTGRLLRTVRERRRRDRLAGLLAEAVEPHERLVLALLSDARDRPAIDAVIARRFPDEAPSRILADAVASFLGRQQATGLDDRARQVLSLSLRGHSGATITEQLGASGHDLAISERQIAALHAALVSSSLLRPLWRSGPSGE